MRLIADRFERLDLFLVRALPTFSRSRLAVYIKDGGVRVDGTNRKSSFMLSPGNVLDFEPPGEKAPHDLTPADIPLEIVFEDEYLLVVDKPRNLVTHPAASLRAPSLVNALLARSHSLSAVAGDFRPGIVHRLDKDTTGLLIVAKTDAAHVALARQIEAKTAQRRYFALVDGRPDQERFKIDAPIARDHADRRRMAVDAKGRNAITHVRLIRLLDEGSLLAIRLETGRTHQIRVHLRAIGHPVVGDVVYGSSKHPGLPLQLHAAYLSFDHPVTGQRIACYAAPPSDFVGAPFCSREAVEDW